MYGEEAKIVAIHAGVECGLFNERLGNLDMISFGPNLYDVHTPDEHMSISSVKNCYEYLLEKLPKNSTLGFDGRVMSVKEGQSLANKLAFKGINIEYKYDLVNDIWEDRCLLPTEKAFLLGTEYSGESFSDKLSRIRAVMKEKKATTHILASLDDIAWLFNIRGRDVKSNPVVLSYAVISIDSVYLFID